MADPSAFLESFPTYRLHSSKPQSSLNGLWVFSSKDEGYESNSYSSDDAGTRMMIREKIVSAFSKIYSNFYRFIVQFWAPVTIGGKLQLSTSGQPFAVSYFHPPLEKYRRRCVEYPYDIDVNSKFRGTPASAFLNGFPEIASMDPSVYHEVDPFLRNAFQECGVRSSFMIPIYCSSQTSSSSDCIGVIDCSSWFTNCADLFNEMNMKIKEVGLGVYNLQDHIPYETINGLKLARDQIQEALKIVCPSHKILLAQVWIASLDENHVHFSSSLEEAQTRQLLGLKLTGYNGIEEDSIDENNEERCFFFQTYYDACDLIPLPPGEKFILKTLQDYEPRFCKNILELGIYEIMGLDDAGSMGLTICMRSIHTGEFNYVFEFLWTHNSFNPILLEEILLNIKRCLPNFKFASGTEIGDKLHVKTLNKLLPVNDNARSKKKRNTTEIELSREDIEQHYGKTMKQAAEELGVSLSTLKRKHNKLGMPGWQGPDLPQRKAYNSNKNRINESHTCIKDYGVIQDPSPIKRNENTVIKAEYADDKIILHLPISEATFVTVKNEIGERFKLEDGTFKIKFLDKDEEWILMDSDQDLSYCIQNSRNVDRSTVQLRVLLHNQ